MGDGRARGPLPHPNLPPANQLPLGVSASDSVQPHHLQAPTPSPPEPLSSEEAEEGRRRLALTGTPLAFFLDSVSGHKRGSEQNKIPSAPTQEIQPGEEGRRPQEGAVAGHPGHLEPRRDSKAGRLPGFLSLPSPLTYRHVSFPDFLLR